MESGNSHCVVVFKLYWTEITQSGMKTLAIVPNLNEFKDRNACSGTGGERLASTFGLEGGEETFFHGVVVAISGTAHTYRNAALGEQASVIMTGILAAPVRMMQ